MPNKEKSSFSSSGGGGGGSSRPGSSSPRPSPDGGGGGVGGGIGSGGGGGGGGAASSSSFSRSRSRDAPGGGGGGGIGRTAGEDSPSRGSVNSDNSENRDMVGGCCVCSDERGWDENPLVYCDGQGCNVAVHQGKEQTEKQRADV